MQMTFLVLKLIGRVRADANPKGNLCAKSFVQSKNIKQNLYG